jgi:Uma2 family endonuclease
MSIIQSQPITEEELIRLAETPGVEYARGQIEKKLKSMKNGAIEVATIYLLESEARKSKLVRVFTPALSFRCFPDDPDKFRKPDVSVIKVDRLAGIDPDTVLLGIVPDLAVEVLSPNDKARKVAKKIEEYLDAGFPLIWVVQPYTRTVTIYRGDGSTALLHTHDEITGEAALPGFKCKIAEFFATVE